MNNALGLLNNIVKLAYNQKPKRPQKTGKTRRETEEIINKGVAQLQASLIAYECLQASVKIDSNHKHISERAVDFYNIKMKEILEGK
jgi:hypothetical protein